MLSLLLRTFFFNCNIIFFACLVTILAYFAFCIEIGLFGLLIIEIEGKFGKLVFGGRLLQLRDLDVIVCVVTFN